MYEENTIKAHKLSKIDTTLPFYKQNFWNYYYYYYFIIIIIALQHSKKL